MKTETLLKGNNLLENLELCESNLKKVRYAQSENVVIRKSYFTFNGIEDSVTIPKTLFRVISKLIESEYIQEVNKLKKELEEL
jgi:hypothetical protein